MPKQIDLLFRSFNWYYWLGNYDVYLNFVEIFDMTLIFLGSEITGGGIHRVYWLMSTWLKVSSSLIKDSFFLLSEKFND